MIWFGASSNPYNITAKDIGLDGGVANVSAGLAQIATDLVTLVGMLAFVFMIVGGLQMTLSAGDPKRFARGRETLIYASVGIVLSVAAYAIISFVAGAF